MLDREYIVEFLKSELEYMGLEIPLDISPSALIEAFYDYLEGNYDAWLRESLSAFLNDGEPDWDWIRERIKEDEE